MWRGRAGYRPEWIAERLGHADGGALVLKRYRHLYPSESYARGAVARCARSRGNRLRVDKASASRPAPVGLSAK
jgi:hypothetical protein